MIICFCCNVIYVGRPIYILADCNTEVFGGKTSLYPCCTVTPSYLVGRPVYILADCNTEVFGGKTSLYPGADPGGGGAPGARPPPLKLEKI
jgi:hypothetical protein